MVDNLKFKLGKVSPVIVSKLEHFGFDANRARRNLPPLQTLVAFEAAARLSSFTLASTELNLTQPAVSQQVRLLENRLGVKLFNRDNNHVSLTRQGKALASVVSSFIGQLIETVEDVRKDSGRIAMSVSLLPSFASTWFASRIGSFQASNPSIDLVVLPTWACVDLARDDDVDVAIRWGRGGWGGYLYEEEVLGESFIAVISPAAMRGVGPIRTFNDLKSVPFVHDTNYNDSVNEWQRLISINGGDPAEFADGVYFGDSGGTVSALVGGYGVGIVRDVLVAHHLKSGALVRLPFESVPGPLRYHFLCRRDRFDHPQIASFYNWLLQECFECARELEAHK